jgi:uncharacterized protein YjbI with pentapeptide repeats
VSHTTLRNANFAGVNLAKAKLFFVDFTDADNIGNKLVESILCHSVLPDGNATGCDLSLRNLSGENLSHAKLRGANLSDVDLSKADLSGADLSLANLSG